MNIEDIEYMIINLNTKYIQFDIIRSDEEFKYFTVNTKIKKYNINFNMTFSYYKENNLMEFREKFINRIKVDILDVLVNKIHLKELGGF